MYWQLFLSTMYWQLSNSPQSGYSINLSLQKESERRATPTLFYGPRLDLPDEEGDCLDDRSGLWFPDQ